MIEQDGNKVPLFTGQDNILDFGQDLRGGPEKIGYAGCIPKHNPLGSAKCPDIPKTVFESVYRKCKFHYLAMEMR